MKLFQKELLFLVLLQVFFAHLGSQLAKLILQDADRCIFPLHLRERSPDQLGEYDIGKQMGCCQYSVMKLW